MKRCSGALNGSACNESERGLGVCTGEGVSQRIHRIGIMEISKELGQQRGTEGPRRGRERRGERLVSGGMEGASCDTTGRNVTRRMTHVGKPNVLGKRGYAHSEAEKKRKMSEVPRLQRGKEPMQRKTDMRRFNWGWAWGTHHCSPKGNDAPGPRPRPAVSLCVIGYVDERFPARRRELLGMHNEPSIRSAGKEGIERKRKRGKGM